MSTSPPHHRTLFSIPRDYHHRRRFRRRLSNVLLIPALSLLVAYVITRPTGGGGFTLPRNVLRASLSAPSSPESEVLAAARLSETLSGARGAEGLEEAASTKFSATAVLGGPYMLDRGPHAVTGVSDILLLDAGRNRVIHLRVFYPNEPGPYPVILFSPGGGGSASCCDALTRHWASYGYVTLQPIPGEPAARRNSGGESDGTSPKTPRESPSLTQDRVRDISFVLDSLSELPNRFPALAGKMDAEHTGVGGQSMDASIAGALGAASINLPGHAAASSANPRVKAILLLSPQSQGKIGLTSHSRDHAWVPTLSVVGSVGLAEERQEPGRKGLMFEGSPPGDTYQMFIKGAASASLVSARPYSPGRSPGGISTLDYTNSASLAFWDAYLKADPKAKMYLQSSALSDFSRGAVSLQRR